MEDQINKKVQNMCCTGCVNKAGAIKVDSDMPWFPLIINLTQKSIKDGKDI